MIYNFNVIPDRRNSESIKWHAYEPDVLPMWVADMDFKSPEPVIQALHRRVEHGVFGYPEGLGGSPKELFSLRQVLIERMEKRYHWHIEPEEILLVPGVVTGFNQVCHMFSDAPGDVLVQTPVYPPFLSAGKHAGLDRRDALLTQVQDGSYKIDWDLFVNAITPQTRLFILCNPHNPVGRVFNRQELECMAEICLSRGVKICADEIHSDLIFNGHTHIPIASLDPEIARNTITLIAPSKTYNIAGLACSIAIIQDAGLRQSYRHATRGLSGWVNLLGLVAAEAAYADGQEWLDQLLVYLQGNRDFLYDYVKKEIPGVSMASPEGTYLAWLDCRQANIEGNPGEFFLKQARVAVNEGATFGSGGEGFVRLNFGCPRSILVEALERMKCALLHS